MCFSYPLFVDCNWLCFDYGSLSSIIWIAQTPFRIGFYWKSEKIVNCDKQMWLKTRKTCCWQIWCYCCLCSWFCDETRNTAHWMIMFYRYWISLILASAAAFDHFRAVLDGGDTHTSNGFSQLVTVLVIVLLVLTPTVPCILGLMNVYHHDAQKQYQIFENDDVTVDRKASLSWILQNKMEAEMTDLKLFGAPLDESRLNLNLRDKNGNTAIMRAAQRGDFEILQTWLQHKQKSADFNVINNDGDTALTIAIKNNNFETAIFLLSQAIESMNLNNINLNSKFNYNYKSNDGRNNINYNYKPNYGDSTSSNFGTEHYYGGIDINAFNHEGDTAVLLCAKRGDVQILEMLAILGANFEVTDKNGDTPMQLALENNNPNVVEFLLSTLQPLCHLEDTDRYGRDIIIPIIFCAAKHGNVNILKSVQKHKPSVDFTLPNGNGDTALKIATKNKHTQVRDFLLKQTKREHL